MLNHQLFYMERPFTLYVSWNKASQWFLDPGHIHLGHLSIEWNR